MSIDPRLVKLKNKRPFIFRSNKINFLYFVFLCLAAITLFSHFNSGESKSTMYVNNACDMLTENPDWYLSLKASEEKWKTPIHVQLGIIRQESAFKHDAKPIRPNDWYEFGDNYASSAVGYSQALDGTWKHYMHDTNNLLRNRESFSDATDFIGWYNNMSHRVNDIAFDDPEHLYLNYHEGWRGYKKKTYEKKTFLVKAKANVVNWSAKYKTQLEQCELTGQPDWLFSVNKYLDYFVTAVSFVLSCLWSLLVFVYDIVLFIRGLFI